MNRILSIALGLAFVTSCDGDDPDDLTQTRWSEAELLSRDWCVQTQIQLAGLTDDAAIEELAPDQLYDFVHTHTGLAPADARPIRIVSFFAESAREQTRIVAEARCKMRSPDGIVQELSIGEPVSTFSCQARNAEALAWADAVLTDEERERYRTEGKQLVLADDRLAQSGSDWIEVGSEWTLEDDAVRLAAATLQIPWDPADPEGSGVHYCKLITPALALDWMLRRAFWPDPVAGPDEASNVRENRGVCESDTPSPGSCIFEFEYTRQHFCQEYTGAAWTPEAARDECSMRTIPEFEAVYDERPCSERGDETATLDGDGTYYGQCVILCGHELETRWHQYSLYMESAADSTCRGEFFDPNGNPPPGA